MTVSTPVVMAATTRSSTATATTNDAATPIIDDNVVPNVATAVGASSTRATANHDDDGMLCNKNQKIIFLDIDGVLNRTKHATHIRLDDDLVLKLKTILDVVEGCNIVLSTFWRYYIEYIKYVLSRYGINPSCIIGATPGYNRSMIGRSSEDCSEYKCRGDEIKSWLRENYGGEDYEIKCRNQFIILDDRPTAAGSNNNDQFLLDHFILCDTNKGLTDENVLKAISILSNTNQS